ncbi:MAG: hypothetical protein Q8942_18255 [Bacillota bacterium]|nr:hypothetical protein [Bacillota bacterium]
MKKTKFSERKTIEISIDGTRIDQIRLSMTDWRDIKGNIGSTLLMIGHKIKAKLYLNALCLLISPKIVVELYNKGILKQDKLAKYKIEIFEWSAECILEKIIYGDINNQVGDDIAVIFNIVSIPQNQEQSLNKFFLED